METRKVSEKESQADGAAHPRRPYSLRIRLALLATIVLLLALGLVGFALNSANYRGAVSSLQIRMESYVYQVLAGMEPESPPVEGAKNDPMMPIVWVRELPREGGGEQRVVCSTIGASVDLLSEGLRRVFVNACYFGLGLEDEIPERSDVEPVGPYEPTFFGFGKYVRGVRAQDHALAR